MSLVAAVAAAQSKPPALLQNALNTLPGVRLLDPPRDLEGSYTVEQLKQFGYWPPWVVFDFDHDGRPDVVAAVVKGVGGEMQYGVMAVHAKTPLQVHWVASLSPQRINGVAAGGRWGDRVTPLYCIECDSNIWLRWSGHEYEADLLNVGEQIRIAAESPGPTEILLSPVAGARAAAQVKVCTKVKIVAVGGMPNARWYSVETIGPKLMRGWIPASSIVLIGDGCFQN